MISALTGSINPFKLLIKRGASLEVQDYRGASIVRLPVEGGCGGIITLLHDVCHDFTIWIVPSLWSSSDPDDPGSLHTLSYRCNPIHIAALCGHTHLHPLLTNTGHYPNTNDPTEEGVTSLHWAVWAEKLDTVRWFIENDANVNAATKEGGLTALHLTMLKGNVAIAEALLEVKATFQRDSYSRSPESLANPKSSAAFATLFKRLGLGENREERLAKGTTDILDELQESISRGDIEAF